jgi:hypothetical protein
MLLEVSPKISAQPCILFLVRYNALAKKFLSRKNRALKKAE